MIRLKTTLHAIKSNLTEIYMAGLLFIGLPLAVSLYLDWRAFVGVSVLSQTIIGVLYVRNTK